MPPIIARDGLKLRFGPTPALRGLDLRVHAGKIHGLLGGNGVGRTTATRRRLGPIAPDRDTNSRFGERILRAVVETRCRIGCVPRARTSHTSG